MDHSDEKKEVKKKAGPSPSFSAGVSQLWFSTQTRCLFNLDDLLIERLALFS